MEFLWNALVKASQELIWLSIGFWVLGLFVRKVRFIDDLRRKWPEARLNLFYCVLDVIIVLPINVLMVRAINSFIKDSSLNVVDGVIHEMLPAVVVAGMALLLADGIGYWRHRLMHTRVLWAIHAVHHSDREMTWLTMFRYHPINRMITTIIGTVVLSLLGFPAFAIAFSNAVRHFHGHFIHADIPWNFGPLRRILVSPVMHQWHHARLVAGRRANFATIFAFYDVVFGTYHLPDEPVPLLGIDEPEFPKTWVGQFLFPFRRWVQGIWPYSFTFR